MRLQSLPPYSEAQQQRSATATSSASATVTTTTPLVILPESRAPDGTLRLHGGPIENRRVKWDEGVIDNEGMGKKSSKVCCIYYRPRAYDESSDSDSSDSSSDDDSDRENGSGSGDGDACGKSGGCERGHNRKDTTKRKSKPNAYERMPKYRRDTGGHS